MISKFNLFEDYGKAIECIKDLKYILEDEGISVSINGPYTVKWHVYQDKDPDFVYVSVYKNTWDTYDMGGSADFREFFNRLQDELKNYIVRINNQGNLSYTIIEIKLKKENGFQK